MSEETVAKGKVVDVTYTITDHDTGEVVEAREVPVSYMHGTGSGVFDAVEEALEGRAAGDLVQVTLGPEQGFGPWDPEMTYTDNIENVPPEYRKLGAEAEFRNDMGESLTMVVTHVDEGTVTLDGNHPLAGRTVTFNVKVAGVREPTEDERRMGAAAPAPTLQ